MRISSIWLSLVALESASAQGVGWGNVTLGVLKTAVARGDRNAQLELGKRYEAGDGVPKDPRKAEKLYRQAADASPRAGLLYTPWAKHHAAWRVTMSKSEASPRLPEAEERLANLQAQRRRR